MNKCSQFFEVSMVAILVFGMSCQALAQSPPDQAKAPFKLATFKVADAEQVGMVLGDRILDVSAANEYLTKQANLSPVSIPTEMRGLIENYAEIKGRMYQIANFFSEPGTAPHDFAYDLENVAIQAPIKYPWNVIAAAANYKEHAIGMADKVDEDGVPIGDQPRRGGFDAAQVAQIDPERDSPVMFAKSPRSCIIGTGEPYFIPPGRDRIDWEGEMAVIIGKPAYRVSSGDAHDYVFGYSIMYDISDRAGRTREVSLFPGPNWFDSKSTDRCAPFGPFIVPKEFLADAEKLRLLTRVNGEVMQDQTTSDLIWNVANLIRFTTSILTLYPGDVIATGTPAGVGAERGIFLKPGDVVTIELEGIGTLVTPIEAYPDASVK